MACTLDAAKRSLCSVPASRICASLLYLYAAGVYPVSRDSRAAEIMETGRELVVQLLKSK
jgi:hypothetical protein